MFKENNRLIITKTPFRISLLSGGSDVKSFYSKYGGLCLNATINYHNYITVRWLPSFFDYKTKLVYSKVEEIKDHKEINHPAIKGVLKYLDINKGIEICHMSDIPGQSGLGTSSSFVVGLLNGISALQYKRLKKDELLKQALHIEHDVLKENTGCQDTCAAVHGFLNQIRISKSGEIRVFPVNINKEKIKNLEDHLMLFYTKIQRKSGEVADTYYHNLGDRPEIIDLAEKGLEVIYKGNFEDLGNIFNEFWKIKREMSPITSSPFIDKICERAIEAGARGTRVSGVGGGGCILFVVPPNLRENVRRAMIQLGLIHIDFKFSQNGSEILNNE